MKTLLMIVSLVVLAGQAQAATSGGKKQNCIDTISFSMNVDSLEAAVACSYGQGAQFTECTIEGTQVMGEAYLATMGYLCGQTTDQGLLSCATYGVSKGKAADVALKSCKAQRATMIGGGISQKVLKK